MWENIVGHETAKITLLNALTKDKVAHAYLFTGSRGLGKETLARTFAQAFFCSDESGPCTTCETCTRIEKGNYPDLHVIEPSGSSIKIDQVRELQKACNFKPYEGIGKVFIIKNAETMTTEAANCLLKVLEEPTPNTVIVLTTENPHNLLPTVLSRCQKLHLKPVAAQDMLPWLESQGIEYTRAQVIATLSDGIPGKAIALIGEGDAASRGETIQRVARILDGDLINVLRIAEEIEKNKDSAAEELELLATWYRDLLVWLETKRPELLINIDMVEQIKGQAYRYSTDKLKKDLLNIMIARKNISGNVNLRLSLENMLLKLVNSA